MVGALRRLKVAAASTVLVLASACAALAPSIPAGAPTAVADMNNATAAGAPSGIGAPGSASPKVPVVTVSAATQAVKTQLGVQVFWHTNGTAAGVEDAADKVFDYIVGLGANSVGITFPIFTDGVHPTKVYSVAGSTPDPATLGLVIGEAKARGLRVMLRPLIDEGNIKDAKGDWRGTIQPPNVAGWFASYRAVLMPYVQLAQDTGVEYFVVGTELTSLQGQTGPWQAIDAAAAQTYTGELDYADNWDTWMVAGSAAPAPHVGMDAYPVLHVTDSATVSQLTTAWTKWLHNRSGATLAKTVLQEVGIPAARGAYAHPALRAPAGEKIDPQIQAKWFAAACRSAQAADLAGIYFWDVDSYADLANAATYDAESFMGRGDQAIRSCFADRWGD